MKKFLVVLLALAMVFGLGSVAFAADTQIADYTDLAGVPAEQQAAIYRLTALGVLAGDGIGGDFRPEDTITRAEFAKIAIYLAGKADAVDLYASFAPAFADVQDGTWYEGYVNAAVAFGYMKGYADDTFKPGQTVTMQEVATVLLRIAGYTDALKGEWPNDYIRKANDTEIIAYVDFVGPRAATRAEVASLANEVLDLEMVTLIENEVAAGLGQIMWGDRYEYVDEDGFTYIKDKTNEEDDLNYQTVLNYAFDAKVETVVFAWNTEYVETSGWAFQDYEDGEMYFLYDKADKLEELKYNTDDFETEEVADSYYIFGADLFSVAWQEAKVTTFINDVDDVEDNEALFVEIKSERIAYDEYEVKSGKDYFDGTKYTVDTKKVGSALNADGYGYIWVAGIDENLTDKGDVYAHSDMTHKTNSTDLKWDIVSEVEVDDEDVEIVMADSSITDVAIGEIKFENDDLDDTIVFIKDGEFVTYEDLEAADVLFAVDEVKDYANEDYKAYLVVSPAEAEVDKIYSENKGEIKIDGIVYNYTTVDTQYSTDNGEEFADAVYDTMQDDKLAEVLYVPFYAWQEVATIAADIEDTDSTFNAVVLGYEAGKKVIGFKDNDIIDDLDVIEELTAIIVLDENGEERTLEFKDLDDEFMAAYKEGHTAFDVANKWKDVPVADETGISTDPDAALVLDTLPELGDAVEITINEKDEITAMYLLAPLSWNGYYGSAAALGDQFVLGTEDYDTTDNKPAQFKVSTKNRIDWAEDRYSFTENTKIVAVYTDCIDDAADCDGEAKYDWTCFEKAELIDLEDLTGKEIKFDYAAFQYKEDTTKMTFVYLVNPEYVGAKGDLEMGLATEHFTGRNGEYFLIDDEEIVVSEDAFDDETFDKMYEGQGLDDQDMPAVVLYRLAGGELTKAPTLDETTGEIIDTTVGKGQIIPIIWNDGYAEDVIQALIDEYYEETVDAEAGDYKVYVGDFKGEKYIDDNEFVLVDENNDEHTIYVDEIEIIDLSGELAEEVYDDLDELCDDMEAETSLRLILIVNEDQEEVVGYVID